MSEHRTPPNQTATPSKDDLRAQALARMNEGEQAPHPPIPGADAQQLLEELRTHQVELEIQNEELRSAQFRAELASNRYQLLFEQLPQPALVLDRLGWVHESNQVARSWLGLGDAGPQTIQFRRATALLPALSLHARAELFKALRADMPQTAQCLPNLDLMTATGTQRQVDLHVLCLPMAYHSDARFLVLMVDRTPEKLHQQDRHLYQSLLDSSQDLIYATDTRGGLMLANRAVLDLFHLAPEMAQGTRRETVMPLRAAIEHNQSDHRVLQTGQPINTTEEVRSTPDDPPKVYLTNKFPLRDAEGTLLGVGAISRDVTAERAAQTSQRMSESVFLQTREAIIVTDAEGTIVRVNPGFERMSGFSAGSVQGHKPSLLRSGRTAPSVFQDLWVTLGEKGHWQGELINRNASGGLYTVNTSISALRGPANELTGYVAVQTDITLLKAAQTEVLRLSHFDSLTHLPNRALLMDRLQQILALSQRQRQAFAILFVDIDHFKEVNDSLGHHVGDELLCSIARRLEANVRAQDTVARMGGDEFVVLLPLTPRFDALMLARKLQSALREPLDLADGLNYTPRTSVGVAVYPDDGATSDELLRHADTAMYVAKNGGRDRAEMYNRAMSDEGERVFSIQTGLTNAVQNNELRLYLQPKFRLGDMALVGAEALVRWERPGHGLTGPSEFIPIAEKSGLLYPIDHWMLRETLALLADWTRQGRWPANWTLALNQTAADLQKNEWLTHLTHALAESGAPAQLLQIELTESALLQPTPRMLEKLHALRDLGVTLAIDDFGTGYSSLSYLKSLPVTVIKIDQSFVRDLEPTPLQTQQHNDNGRVLIEAMIALAHKLGSTLVAEGVETDAQRRLLHHLGCELGQGYLLSRPVPTAEFAQNYLAPKLG